MNDALCFWSNLRFWSFHVILNATPSFIIACSLSREDLDRRIAGMVAGVGVFIIGYTWLTSSSWFRLRIGGGPFGKALKLATRIRSFMATVGLVGALSMVASLKPIFHSVLFNFAILEVYAGFLAGLMVEAAGKIGVIRKLRIALTSSDAGERAQSWWLGDMNSAIPTFLWTVTEGLLLSILMLGIAVVIYVAGKVKRRYLQR